MPSLPTVGGSANTWGTELNAYLEANKAGLNVKDFGALGNGSNDDTSAIQAAIDEATTTIYSTARGDTVFLPKGVYMISDTLDVKNYVRLVGANENAVRIKATAGFPINTPMVTMGPLGSGNGDVYGVRLENLRLDCSEIDGSTGIEMNDCNEHCGLFNVEVRNFDNHALDVTASAHITLESFAASGFTTSDSLAVVHLHSNGGPVWMRSLGNLSTGRTGGTPAGSAGILVETSIISVLGAHFEWVENGIDFQSGWGGFVAHINGHTSVTNTLRLSNTHAGTVACIYIDSQGGTNAILDEDTPATRTGTVYYYPWT